MADAVAEISRFSTWVQDDTTLPLGAAEQVWTGLGINGGQTVHSRAWFIPRDGSTWVLEAKSPSLDDVDAMYQSIVFY